MTLTLKKGYWQHLAFSPDGKTLASGGGYAQALVLWDVVKGTWKATVWQQRKVCLVDVAYSPDGRTLAASDNQGVIRLWETYSLKERAILRVPPPVPRDSLPLCFSPDGRLLASNRGDECVTLWDLAKVKGARAPGTVDLGILWSSLEDRDAVPAYRAIRTLSAFPRQAVPFLRQQLRPPLPPTAAQLRRIDQMVPDLDSEDFPTRQKARDELAKVGQWAEPALRRALAKRPSSEVRKQAKALLEGIATAKAARLLQRLRALEVLEHMDDAGARALLADLAKTAPEARVRDDAKASLQRVRKRPPPTIIKPRPPDGPPRPPASPRRKAAPRPPSPPRP